MVLDIRSRFRWWADAELENPKAMLLIKSAGRQIFLMGVKFQPIGVQIFRHGDEMTSPAGALAVRADIKPVYVGTVEGQIAGNFTACDADPDIAALDDHVLEKPCVIFQRMGLPGRQERISGIARAAPYIDHRGFISWLIGARVVDGIVQEAKACLDKDRFDLKITN